MLPLRCLQSVATATPVALARLTGLLNLQNRASGSSRPRRVGVAMRFAASTDGTDARQDATFKLGAYETYGGCGSRTVRGPKRVLLAPTRP